MIKMQKSQTILIFHFTWKTEKYSACLEETSLLRSSQFLWLFIHIDEEFSCWSQKMLQWKILNFHIFRKREVISNNSDVDIQNRYHNNLLRCIFVNKLINFYKILHNENNMIILNVKRNESNYILAITNSIFSITTSIRCWFTRLTYIKASLFYLRLG